LEKTPELAEATDSETVKYLDNKHDIGMDQNGVVCPAGENQVRFASIMTSKKRAFGGEGLSAVLGSKIK
jgi:aldehyde:ferredoxin oxidoreductase